MPPNCLLPPTQKRISELVSQSSDSAEPWGLGDIALVVWSRHDQAVKQLLLAGRGNIGCIECLASSAHWAKLKAMFASEQNHILEC